MESLISQEWQLPGIKYLSKHNRSKDNAAQIVMLLSLSTVLD